MFKSRQIIYVENLVLVPPVFCEIETVQVGLAEAVEISVFFEVDMVLKPVLFPELAIFDLQFIAFGNHLLLEIDQKRPLCALVALHCSTKNNHLIFVFIVVEAPHISERWDFFWWDIMSVESRGHSDQFPLDIRAIKFACFSIHLV